MKVVILAGGFGTRLSEETTVKPKPMVEIGEKPILWHIMKIYSAYGFNEFIICLGFKGYVIKEYFANYFLHMSDITFDMSNNNMEVHNNHSEPWKVTLIDTGADTMTGGRLKRAKDFLDEETFCFTYGDGVSDINIRELIEFHKSKNATATMTAVQPPGRFGALSIAGTKIQEFQEKPMGESGWVNGGFFVLEPEIFDYIENDHITWEKEPLERLAAENNLHAFKHTGFWQAMDTLLDKIKLDEYWNTDSPPWKVW